jgi:undecaprenyl-diphosphatase
VTDRPDAGHRLAVGLTTLALAAIPARRAVPSRLERDIFEAVNRLPDALFVPVWPVMQLGAFAAVPLGSGVAAVIGERTLSRRMLATGTTTWLAAKVIKRHIGRGRPDGLLPHVQVRGRAATGHGFLSGHTGVATALAAAAVPHYPGLRAALAGVAATVGVARIYVGAHLPLDVVGGAALGLSVDAAITCLLGD